MCFWDMIYGVKPPFRVTGCLSTAGHFYVQWKNEVIFLMLQLLFLQARVLPAKELKALHIRFGMLPKACLQFFLPAFSYYSYLIRQNWTKVFQYHYRG